MAPVSDPLALTNHPIQRAGAWATAILAGRDHPAGVDDADLRRVAQQISGDLYRSATASAGDPAYDWWKVQYAMYPNSPVTHTARTKWTDLRQRIAALFDEGAQITGECCVFCGQPASARWAKDLLPMFDTAKARNTLPPAGNGWPVCWGCRVAVWAMPYGAAVAAGSATVLTGGSEELEHRFARRNVKYAMQIQAIGFGKTVRGTPERVVVAMLRTIAADESVTLWAFKNDNQDPWLHVHETRRPVARFVRGLSQNPDALRGWATLCRVLQRRDKAGTVVQSGADLAARTLFEHSGRPSPVLLERIISLVSGRPGAYPRRDWHALAALARHYAKEMLAMDTAAVLPVAELIARWIGAGTSQRGRFNEYVKVAMDRHQLGRLLMAAEARLLLDSRPGDAPLPMRAEDALRVIDRTGDAVQQRMLLFFAVVDALVERGAVIGSAAAKEKETDGEDDSDDVPVEEVLRSGDKDSVEEYTL